MRSSSRIAGRIARGLGVVVLVLLVLALASFAIPVPVWRTGELPAPPLALVEAGPAVAMPKRLWIDTDAACGHGPRTDPDDCFAILLLASNPDVEIVGVSTVHGNAPLGVVDPTVRELMAVLERQGAKPVPVYRGSAGPTAEDGSIPPEPAHEALRKALADGPLTLVSLGPLTNVAAALRDRPELQAKVGRLLAVMGRRPGHLFHPAEGTGGGMLFGHGPVFRDFNFAKDPIAASQVLKMGLEPSLLPYDAARDLSLTGGDLARMEARGGAAGWVASRAHGWLGFWKEDIGRDGFYPFDLLAAAYAIEPRLFDCAKAIAWVAADEKLWTWFYSPDALLVGPEDDGAADAKARNAVLYCPQIDPMLHSWLMSRLGPPAHAGTQAVEAEP